MPKIADSLQHAAAEVREAAGDGHHIVMGPGEKLVDEWLADGLELPDLQAMRQYRIDRVREQMRTMGYDGAILFDPLNIRYATDSTNMQIWVMHNAARYCWVGLDESCIVWEFVNCEFMEGHNPLVSEVRPATASTFFTSGPRQDEHAHRWSDEMIGVITEHAGPGARIAVDQCHRIGYQRLTEAGFTLGSGQEMMELARHVKGPDEIKAMRCAANACQSVMGEMRASVEPGMTEREVWALLHAGNIARGGEWIETQILASGPRTNPWMQEASSRVLEDGDFLAYDTDLVGVYGMMIDISRTWSVGDAKPTAQQQHVHALAREQLDRNFEMLTPGRTFRELTFDSWSPSAEKFRRYCCQFHGVGQCDEYPEIYWPDQWDSWGFDGVIVPNTVYTVESYVGSYDGGQGVKLEQQVLVTENGPELLTDFPLDL